MVKDKESYFYGEHFEALGGMWSAIYGNVAEFIKDYLVKSCQKGSLYWTEKINEKLIFSLLYPGAKKRNPFIHIPELLKKGDDYVQIINYIEDDKPSKTHITACPVLKGIRNSLKIKETYAWENNGEGEVAAESLTVNELILNFFDPFYCFDTKYGFKIDEVCDVYLSAIAYEAEKLEERDDVYTEGNYYEHCLEEFLKENPDKTKEDFEPVVVRMRAEHFRMFAHTETTSVTEIVGLIEDIKYIKALGKKFAVLKVNLEHREDNEYLYVNVYIPEHLLEKYKPEVNQGIHAMVHMFGFAAGEKKEKGNEEDGCYTTISAIIFWIIIIIAIRMIAGVW